jgi:hypothetical protein
MSTAHDYTMVELVGARNRVKGVIKAGYLRVKAKKPLASLFCQDMQEA